MARLVVHVEGETEEAFVNEVLSRHLYEIGYHEVWPRIVGNARIRSGGIKSWVSVKADIVRHLKEDQARLATTLVDFYGLPQDGTRAWPGRAECNTLPFDQKAPHVEAALAADVAEEMGWEDNHESRFIPFVVMHEFEGLLFSDCDRFARAIGKPALARPFQDIRDQFGCPEEINDSPQTAPSKRIKGLLPKYQKPLFGNVAALEIGLDSMRQECPHFNQWLEVLESHV